MKQNGNPVFRQFNQQSNEGAFVDVSADNASWKGVISKTFILIATAIAAGISVWFLSDIILYILLSVGIVVSFISVFIAMRNPAKARNASIVYALFQGISYGTLTRIVEMFAPGVGLAALGGTFAILAVMAGLHAIGAVRATPKIARFVMSVLITVMLVSFVMFIATLINPSYVDSIYDNFPLMIIVSAFLIIVGALMLVMDFDNAKLMINSGAPKAYEWQASLGIMITLVWIYVRVLRFVLLLVSRNRD